MHKDHLPNIIDPYRFAENAITLNGTYAIEEMTRLGPSLFSPQGQVKVVMTFGVDEQDISYVKGHLNTNLVLQCQRCMESFEYEIISDFALGMVQTEAQAEQLPESYDPLIVNDNELNLCDMIEEELIVSLPIVPMHDEKDCKIQLPLMAESNFAAETEKQNPFKVIESLRSNRDKK